MSLLLLFNRQQPSTFDGALMAAMVKVGPELRGDVSVQVVASGMAPPDILLP